MPIKNNVAHLKKRVRKPRSKDDTHYVDNKEFLDALTIYREQYLEAKKEGKPLPRIPNYIGSCFMKIAEKFSHHQSFVGYPFKEEMISDAIENCIMYAHDFDPERGKNPFAYFTQTVWHAFIRRINKENRNKYINYKSHQMQSLLTGSERSSFGSDNGVQSKELYDNITAYIDDYERKIKEKKLKKKNSLKAKNSAKPSK